MTRATATPFGDRARRYARPPDASSRALFHALRAVDGVVDVVVTEAHVAITFAREPAPSLDAIDRVLASRHDEAELPPPRTHEIAVRYDGEDLNECAERLSLAPRALVELHARRTYEVKLIGFLPGFAYLGDVDPRLVLPRRSTPRPRVAPASVAMGDAYTAIYPFASPGGWHLLGTALDFRPFAFALGDRVRFVPR